MLSRAVRVVRPSAVTFRAGVRSIAVGETLPALPGTFKIVRDGKVSEVTMDEVFRGRKVVMFGIPGAFTPVCSGSHVPGFIAKSGDFKSKRVDEIVCLTPNDHFVAKAFAKDQIAGDSIAVLADGNLTLTKALKMEVDMSKAGMGLRSNRFAMVIDNGVVTGLNVEKGPGNFETSDASNTLALLK